MATVPHLVDFCSDRWTDKNTVHSYLPAYEALFEKKRLTAKRILEIGIGPIALENGGSLLMWSHYFPNAAVYGMDIIPMSAVNAAIIRNPQIYLYTSNDAYDPRVVDNHFTSKSVQFDILIDDGPHTLPSMCEFLRLYLPLLAPDGILVIEDVQSIEWIDTLRDHVPDAAKPFIRVIDRRDVKGRYDDLLFVIDRS